MPALVGCDRKGEQSTGTENLADEAAPVTLRREGSVNYIHGATRCGDCHNRMLADWQGSAHSQAATRPSFLATARLATDDEDCDRCHAPLRAVSDEREPAVPEGVTCDVCHTIDAVEVGARSSRFELQVDGNVKYGPRCDAKGHYFHDMGCSSLHEEAELCAACHNYQRKVGDAWLPIYTTYQDWRSGPLGDAMPCQGCHMPRIKGAISVAEGEEPRKGVGMHGQLTDSIDLRKKAIALAVEVDGKGDQLSVRARLSNKGAGHYIPTGLPARRLVIRSRVELADGTTDSKDEVIGRILVDAAGVEAPHVLATRVSADTRLAAESARTFEFEHRAAGDGKLVIEVWWRSMSKVVASRIGAEPREELMATAEVSFGAPREGRRRPGLPGKVEVGP